MRSDQEILQDIREAIQKIEQKSLIGKDAFFNDEMFQIWMIHYLQIIGEASNSMSETFKNHHSQIPWRKIADFRNVLVHEYFNINLEIVWKIIESEIPFLKQQINQI